MGIFGFFGLAALAYLLCNSLFGYICKIFSGSICENTEMDSAFCYRGVITGDLDRLDILPGIYSIVTQESVQNAPDSTLYCAFMQLPGSYKVQALICGDNYSIKVRKYTGDPSNWRSWI